MVAAGAGDSNSRPPPSSILEMHRSEQEQIACHAEPWHAIRKSAADAELRSAFAHQNPRQREDALLRRRSADHGFFWADR